MTASPRHELDEIIDRVAAKMVAIDGDGGVMARVMAQLPERAATPWWLTGPAQLTAGAALVLVAFLWARPLGRPAASGAELVAGAPEPAPRVEVAIAEPPPLLAGVRIPDPGPRIPDPGSRIPAVSADRPDHERSLAPVDSIEALELSAIAPSAMEFAAPSPLDPLVLTELALSNKGDR